MTPKRSGFQRRLGKRRHRKLFVVATEGTKTEPMYFRMLNDLQKTGHVECLASGGGSSPLDVLSRMEKYLKENGNDLRESDEIWLVVDRDQWPATQLDRLQNWAEESNRRDLALSNPKFEYWLLLHFEDGLKIKSPSDCDARLREHLPDYDKGITPEKFTVEIISEAIKRGKLRDNPRCSGWPSTIGCTTVYRLVDSILQS